jgi:hypothetical protein
MLYKNKFVVKIKIKINIKREMNIQEIYDKAREDPALFSTIDINALLENIESETTEYLEDQTISSISKTIYSVLNESGIFPNINIILDKLVGYRYVERVCEIRQGIYIRWINPIKRKLENGGVVISVKICDEGVQVICKTAFGLHISFKFDECIVFQKLTTEEQLILMSYEYIQKTES